MSKSSSTEITPRGLNTEAAARYLGLSPSFLEKSRIGKTKTPGPKFKKIGKRILYLRDVLDDFLEQSDSQE